MSKISKMCEISSKTRKIVFNRDLGRCVICGNNKNVMPNSHFIRRSQLGLGIEQNVFTACTNFTEKKCHERWDNYKCTPKEVNKVKKHFKSHYPKWNEKDLVYRKYIIAQKKD